MVQVIPQGLVLLEYDIGSHEVTRKGHVTVENSQTRSTKANIFWAIVAAEVIIRAELLMGDIDLLRCRSVS